MQTFAIIYASKASFFSFLFLSRNFFTFIICEGGFTTIKTNTAVQFYLNCEREVAYIQPLAYPVLFSLVVNDRYILTTSRT